MHRISQEMRFALAVSTLLLLVGAAYTQFISFSFFQRPFFSLIMSLYGLGLVGYISLISRKIYLNQGRNAKSKKHVLASKLEQGELETLFQQTHIGMAVLSLEGKFVRVNALCCDILGYTESELLALNFLYFVDNTQLNHLKKNLQQLLMKETLAHHSEYQCYKKNGEIIWVMLAVSFLPQGEQEGYYVVQLQNISKQKHAEEQLRQLAFQDVLTRLANRAKFEEYLDQALLNAHRSQKAVALLLLDIDYFKTINDTLGHEGGDSLLQVVAQRLQASVRKTDLVARLGGDEFVIVLYDIKNKENAESIAQKILQNTRQKILLGAHELEATVSMGISLYPEHGQSKHVLMEHADLALYSVKAAGRNNYYFYDDAMSIDAQKKVALQTALGHAIVNNEFILHYQPSIHMQSKRIISLEPIISWNNKVYSLDFENILQLAQETGLTMAVGEWLLEAACQQLQAWHEAGLPSVNMIIPCFEAQLKHATFSQDVAQLLQRFSFPLACLHLAINESTLATQPEKYLALVNALKNIGLKITITQFGSGRLGLSNLRYFIGDQVKLDKLWVQSCVQDKESGLLVQGLLALAHKLHMPSLAPAVESAAQYEFLEQAGCVEVQGPVIMPTLSPHALGDLLQ